MVQAHMKRNPSLQELISDRIKKQNLSRSTLIKSLGYTNITRGLRRFDHFLKTLESPNDQFIRDLLSVLGIDAISFLRALSTSKSILDAEAETRSKKAFIPFLEVLIDDSRTPFFAAQIYFSQRRIQVSGDIRSLPLPEELNAVFSIYKNHVKDLVYGLVAENMPSILPLSEEEINARLDKIRGFKYFRTHNILFEFNNDFVLINVEYITDGTKWKWELGNKRGDFFWAYFYE